MIKKFHFHRIVCTIFIFIFMLLNCYSVTFAADDPGAGRLSGKNIPEEFYGDQNNAVARIARYGTFDTPSPFVSNKTYSHQDIFTGRQILDGVDVSQWQGKNINWTTVQNAGIEFAFVRVGYRGYGDAGTLNENTKDIYFDQNMKNAIAAGVPVGIYIFSQAITTDEAKEEANYILEHIGSYQVSMPLIMDYEYASDSSGGRLKKANLSKKKATEICMAFCDTIAAAGYMPMVYANKSMLNDQLNAKTITDAGYPIWLAHYTTNTDYAGTFDFWQYSSTGSVSGISGNVDMNFYYAKEGDNFVPEGMSIASAKISPIPDQAYTGKNITPSVTVTCSGIPLTQGIDYVVTYKNNKALGTATATITGIGKYHGSKQVKFNICLKKVSSVKAKKRSTTYITLKWAKNTTATGYQIWRSTSLNGTYKKIKQISKNSTVTYKNTGLTKGQCYYYKVRSYKKSGSKIYYSPYSSVATIYTKLGYSKKAIAKNGAKLYASASSADTVIAAPAKNTSMTVTYSTKDNKNATWYRVSYKSDGETYTGFVPASKVTINMTGKVTKTNVVNVRKSTSTSSKKLTTLKKNKKVTVLKTKKKKGVTWYQVTFKKSGKTYKGWIAAPYLKLV